ncbi:MAG: CoA transferase [Actinomycetota bacterium]|nr:CoA transferase [Actinomycetota bacterium]
MRDTLPTVLEGTRLVTLAQNVPGPAAAARLREFGASIVKIEPPEGDPLSRSNPAWYEALATGNEVIRLDLKDTNDRDRLDDRLAEADVLLTSSRPGALRRLGLGPEELGARYPGLCRVAITGYPAPREDEPGHDLTYLAAYGLLAPPDMPRTLLADLAGAERAVTATLALLLNRDRGDKAGCAEVPLSEAAAFFGEPLRYGITAPGDVLGGGLPGYNLYRASDGWIAVAALEEHFWLKLQAELRLKGAQREDLEKIFRHKSAEHWEEWAAERDLPLKAVSSQPSAKSQTTNSEEVNQTR